MSDERAGFLRAIKDDPLDDVTRKIYADWLDERDETEEANRQRGWVRSYHFLKRFADPYTVQDGGEPDLEGVISHIEGWKRQIERDGEICFNSDYCQDALHDEDVKREFWEHFSLLSGCEVPEELKQKEWYRCAC